MKTRFTKIVVPTLAIAIGAAIVGSVSGTVAWYQYSTRASTAYLGTSAGTSGNLKLRIKGTDDWLNSLTKEAIQTYLEGIAVGTNDYMGKNLQPITSGAMGEDDAIALGTNDDMVFYQNPIREYENETSPYSSWLRADESMYVTIPLQIAYIEYDNLKVNDEDQAFLQKDVYLSDLLIQEDYKNNDADPEKAREDLSEAIRVHFHAFRDDDESQNLTESTVNRLVSKKGGTVLTEGYLDLDGVDGDDTIKTGDTGANYGFGDPNLVQTKKVVYGDGSQVSYSASDTKVEGANVLDIEGDVAGTETIYPAVVKSVVESGQKTMKLDENDFEFTKEGAAEATKKALGHTIASEKGDANEGKFLNVEITIWIEGWQQLKVPGSNPAEYKSMWSETDYIGSMFDVGIQFAVQAK